MEEREVGKGKQCHSFSSQTGAIQSHSLECWLRGDGWLFPVSPALTSTQCSDNSHETTTCSCCSPSPFLASLWHRFTPLFSQGDIPKVQNLELEQGRGGVMGSKSQHVPSLPGHKPCTSHPCSQPLRFSQSTNKACPTRNGAACSNLPQKGRFSEKCHRQSSRDVESVPVSRDVPELC